MTPIPAHILQQAIELYLQYAYPGGTLPPAAQERAKSIRDVPPSQNVPESLLEKESSASLRGYALRLGQPLYPHMKLIIEPAPGDPAAAGVPNAILFLLRVDSHDRHLHATPGSPDEVWLSSIRASNKLLGEQIEAAWSQHGLPTFKDYLRSQLAAKRAQQSPH